jgi:hypothetical protein
MNKKEFCEIMSGVHKAAAKSLLKQADMLRESHIHSLPADALEHLAARDTALARAFNDAAGEEND